MDFLDNIGHSIGNFFTGLFSGGDDEEKKRREREAARRRQQQQQLQQQRNQQQGVQNVKQMFGTPDNHLDQFKVEPKPLFQEQKPEAPKPTPQPTQSKPQYDYAKLLEQAKGYQQPGVQDINNYYGSDLKKLQDEVAKGDKADANYVQGLMQSLDNRKKELESFHQTHPASLNPSQDFETALRQNEKQRAIADIAKVADVKRPEFGNQSMNQILGQFNGLSYEDQQAYLKKLDSAMADSANKNSAAARQMKQYLESQGHVKNVVEGFAQGVGQQLQGFARVPETLFRSVAQMGASAIDPNADTSQQGENTGWRRVLYGKDPVKTYFSETKDLQDAIKNSDNSLAQKIAPTFTSPLVTIVGPAVLAALDIMPGGPAKKKAVEEVTKTAIEKESKRLGRELTKEEADAVTTQVERRAANPEKTPTTEKPVSETPNPDVPQTKPLTEVERQAEQSKAAATASEKTKQIQEDPNLNAQQKADAIAKVQQDYQDIIKSLENSAEDTAQAVAANADKSANAIKAQQATSADVRANQANQITPAPDDVVQGKPAPANPEVAANDATNPNPDGTNTSTEDLLFSNSKDFKERNGLNLLQRLSPDRWIREKLTNPLEAKGNQVVAAAQTAGTAPARGLGRLFTGFSKEAGVTPELQTSKMQLRGGVETGKYYREKIADLSKDMTPEERTKVWATLDPELAARKDIQPGELTPEQTVLRDKLKVIIDNTTAENLRRGLITPEQAASESYIKRSYSIYDGNTEAGKFERGFRQELLGQYRGRKEISDEMVDEAITDPTYLVGKKAAESHAMWAMQDYGNYLAKTGRAIDKGQPGYTQLPDTAVFGEAAGKWVPRNIAEDFTGFQYNHALVSAFNDLITAYDRLGIRQAKKQLLTIFNPAVRLGNQLTNRVVFAQLNGINPVQFNLAYSQVGKMAQDGDQLYREAVAQGLTGVDITQADFYAQRIAATAGQDKGLAKKAVEYMQKSYSGADDKARVAAYVVHRRRGYSPEEAARLTQRGFQDYKSVGFFYDMAAKTPFIGNAFVRFAADATRIAKNAALDHPLRTLGTVAMWSAFVNGMSVLSGESDLQGDSTAEKAFNLVTGKSKSDAQKTREGRFGGAMLPFTNISLAVQTPWGEVNVARFMPWYQLNDISSTGVSKFLPIQANPLKPEGWQDPLLGQFGQVAVDRDFRGKSIQDPAIGNTNGDQFAYDPLSQEERLKNVGRFLFTNNAPLGREVDSLVSAAKGQPDIYGKDRSVPQAIARALGVKVEQYGPAQVDDQKSREAYFNEKDQIDKQLEGMSPDQQTAWKKLTGYFKLRDQVANEFAPGETRNKKAPVFDFSEDKWKEYAAHPELYNLMVQKKQQDKARQGSPIQPEFDERLSASFRKQLIQNKMVAPGDDAELDQRMYSSPEWDYYMKLKDQYKKDAAKYYPDNGGEFTDELVKHQDAKFPEKPAAYAAYTAAYGKYANGETTQKPEFTDAVKVAKLQYDKATFDWTNQARKARGLPAITWDMWQNPTFGYDDSPSGYGFGYGGGGGYNFQKNTLGDLTNFTASVNPLSPIEAQAMPSLIKLFNALQAGGGGNRKKPPLGAASKGQG